MYFYVASALMVKVFAELMQPMHWNRESSLLSPWHGSGMNEPNLSPMLESWI